MIKMHVVWVSFKGGVFVLQNSRPLWGWTVHFYDIAPEMDITFYQLYLLLDIPSGIRFALNDVEIGRRYASDLQLWQYGEFTNSNQNN